MSLWAKVCVSDWKSRYKTVVLFFPYKEGKGKPWAKVFLFIFINRGVTLLGTLPGRGVGV